MKPRRKTKLFLPFKKYITMGPMFRKKKKPDARLKKSVKALKLIEPEGGGVDLSKVISKVLPETPKESGAAPELLHEKASPLLLEVGEIPTTGKILEKYGQVEILSVKGEVLPLYKIKMPELTREEQKLLNVAKEKAAEEIKIDPDRISDPSERQRVFMHEILKIIERESKGTNLPPGRIKQLGEAAVRDMLGYGQLDPMIADDRLEDIMVTAVGKPVYVYHRKYGMCFTNVTFETEDTIRYFIDKMARLVGRRIDQQTPLLDARLPDGSRVNATIPPVSLEGPTISIRKFRKDPLTIIDILNYGTLSLDVAAFIWLCVDGLGAKPANIIFAGGTGCGKTTILNAATTFVPERERIISIEDTAELQLPHKHWVRLETRPPNVEGRGEITMDDLVKNALRMRPDRMIVGEVRGPEARTMFTAMNTGHEGAVIGDTLIQISDGRLLTIEDLVSNFFRSSPVKKDGDFEYADVNGPAVKSLNEQNLKFEDSKITRVWRRKYAGKLLRIRTLNGKEILLTHDHPVYSVANEWRKINSENLKEKDYIGTPLIIRAKSGRGDDLAYLAGYVRGDGCIGENTIQVVDGDPQLLENVIEEFENHSSHKITCSHYDAYHRAQVWDRNLAESLKNFLGTDQGLLGDNSLSHYLGGIFDAEAHVNTYSRGIEFSSKSPELVRSIPHLMLRFGIHSSVSSQEFDGKGNRGPYYKILIYGRENLERFHENIGFRSQKKEEKLREILRGKGSNGDLIPGVGDIIKKERLKVGLTQEGLAHALGKLTRSNIRSYETGVRKPQRGELIAIAKVLESDFLKTLADSEIRWEKIKSIEEVEYEGYIYDLTLDKNHNYVANGIIVSNCMGTVHSNSAAETVTRLTEAPMSVPTIMIPALDVIVMQQRIYHRQKGQIRRVTEVAEITGFGEGKPQLNWIFEWNARDDVVEPTGVPSKTKRTIADFSGVGSTEVDIELEKRAAVLEWMRNQSIRNIFEVGRVIQEYYRDPEAVMKRVRGKSTKRGQ